MKILGFRFSASVACALTWASIAPIWAQVPAEPPPPPVASTPTPAPTPAPTASEAERLGEQGRDAYRTANYAEALKLFEKAFVLDDNPRWLYNMARCKEKQANYREAVRLIERYLDGYRQRNAGQEPTDAEDAKRLITDLKRRAFEALPEVEIKSVPAGAQVLLGDGSTIGSTPVNTHMEPGRYKITLKLTNHADVDAELAVPQTGKVSLVFGLKNKQKQAAIAVWSNIRGAQVALDGKVVAVTPFQGQIAVEPGRHQLMLERTGFRPVERELDVPEDSLVTARVHLELEKSRSSWRSGLGWPMLLLGVVGAGAGGFYSYMANQEYVGTPAFTEYEGYQNLGYRAGGAAAGVGLGLLIWDALRDNVGDEERVLGPDRGDGITVAPLKLQETP